MKSFKKLFLSTILSVWALGLMLSAFRLQLSFAEDFFYQSPNLENIDKQNIDEKLNIGQTLKNDSLAPENSILRQIRNYFSLWDYGNEKAPAIAYIRMIINRLLGLVSFVALIIVIYAFYQIFGGKWEEWVAKAKKMLTWVAIALAVMWLSRLIVSFFFSIYTANTAVW